MNGVLQAIRKFANFFQIMSPALLPKFHKYRTYLERSNDYQVYQAPPSCPPQWYSNIDGSLQCVKIWDQTIGAVGSLLTLFILIIYIRQNILLEKQAEAMEAAYTPAIFINSVEAMNSNPLIGEDYGLNGEVPNEGDFVKFSLTNIGNEVAKDLQVKYIVQPVNQRIRDRFFNNFPIKAGSAPLIREDLDTQNSRGAVIPENAENINCYAEVVLKIDKEEATSNPYQFRNAIIPPLSGRRIRFGMILEYSNSAGKEDRIPIEPGIEFKVPEEWEISRVRSFKQIYDSAIKGEKTIGIEASICDINRIRN